MYCIKIEVTDNYTHLILKVKLKQYKKVNIANFVYYGKTRMKVSFALDTREWTFYHDIAIFISHIGHCFFIAVSLLLEWGG